MKNLTDDELGGAVYQISQLFHGSGSRDVLREAARRLCTQAVRASLDDHVLSGRLVKVGDRYFTPDNAPEQVPDGFTNLPPIRFTTTN